MKAIRVSHEVLLPALLATLLATGLAGCVAPAAPPPPPAPRPVAPPPPAPPPAPADWRDAPQTPGAWRWSAASGRSTASYGQPGQPAVATLTCDAAARATILWTTGAATGPVPLVVTTTGTRRILTATPAPAGGSAIALPANDPLLDAIAFSRGRFMLESGGSAPLYLPAWPELSRVIEDCRQGTPAAA